MQDKAQRRVLNKIPVGPWVLGTAQKMHEAGTDTVSDWNRFAIELARKGTGAPITRARTAPTATMPTAMAVIPIALVANERCHRPARR